MARRVQIILEDDMEGGAADRTVEFSFDGSRYEVDLNSANVAKLADALAPFIAVARQVGGRRATAKGRGRAASTPTRGRTGEVRAWAKAQGMTVSERGRVPASVQEAYDAAH